MLIGGAVAEGDGLVFHSCFDGLRSSSIPCCPPTSGLSMNAKCAQVGEVGELSEIFQWKGEVAKGVPDWKEEEKLHLGEELSDVLLYLVRLSDVCGVDLGKAALRKLQLNAIKYPPPPPPPPS